MHEPLTNLRPVIFVQFARGTPRTEVWRGAARRCDLQAECGKIVIAMSEDIDPDNIDAVFWSLAYRCNPIEDVHIAPYRGGVQGSQYGDRERGLHAADRRHAERARWRRWHCRRRNSWSGAGVVGGARPAADHAQAAVARLYAGRLDRALGHLGGARGARRVGGTGKETLARQRTGLKPETPARKVDG